jgi:peptidoglycan biosynthesis protein MviN/MurJ (putative lipid II flippase)
MTALRFVDVGLVIATAPFVALAGLPGLGYGLGAGAWILTRFGAEWLERRAAGDPRQRVGYQVAGMMGRVWIVVCAVVAAKVAGGRDDGVMAAVLVLAAFTVYFATSLLVRQLERNVVRP